VKEEWGVESGQRVSPMPVCNLSRDGPSRKGVRSQESGVRIQSLTDSWLLTPDFCARRISRLMEYALLPTSHFTLPISLVLTHRVCQVDLGVAIP
jgi:hypothetical protein